MGVKIKYFQFCACRSNPMLSRQARRARSAACLAEGDYISIPVADATGWTKFAHPALSRLISSRKLPQLFKSVIGQIHSSLLRIYTNESQTPSFGVSTLEASQISVTVGISFGEKSPTISPAISLNISLSMSVGIETR